MPAPSMLGSVTITCRHRCWQKTDANLCMHMLQVDMSISRKYGGFGLGLNIVQVRGRGGAMSWPAASATPQLLARAHALQQSPRLFFC